MWWQIFLVIVPVSRITWFFKNPQRILTKMSFCPSTEDVIPLGSDLNSAEINVSHI
jgi:hypothetical protein